MNLATLLANVARRMGDAPAISDGDGTIGFLPAMERISRIAGALHAAGLKRGDRVALVMENCGAFFEILFAAWTAGLCAVPVNAKLHPLEVEHIARDCGARWLFTTPGLVEGLAGLETSIDTLERVVCVGTADYAALARGEPMAPVEVDPAERAWIFYTSGTTGRPKGAVLSHRNLLFMCHAYYADIDQVDHRDVKLHTAALSHGSGLYGLPLLLRGGRQIIMPGFDVPAIVETLSRHDSVSMFVAPTMLTRLVHSPLAAGMRVDGLRTICYGGGPMYVADLERALELFGPRLYQIYGQGESPMTITGLDKAMHVADGAGQDLRSCGPARTGVAFRVVDDEDRDLPTGEVGEVLTRSDCMMEGYWNNPEASAQTLRGGWLHTGDVGSVDARGFLTLSDRSKDLIISGGANIYPREIEEVLLRHPDLVEASVIGRPHPEWGEEVVAFVVAKPGAEVGAADLDALCIASIARFKRPKSYRFVESLPKNAYGKILKRELRDLVETPAPDDWP
ncbi:MAG: long-chain fatty acid--CoA ligase [Salinarimonadaceae bacterium]|nr:MAG: long-chain fatty acid--CoA ligase [Salinarimonadaceae bacterium]